MKSAAIAIVRNAVDLAPLTALHHWLIGVDRLWVVDNGSTDGTYEALKWLADRLPGFRVDSDPGPFNQARMTNDLANALLREGFQTIIPFDADECWNLSLRQVAAEFRRHDANVLSYPVVNYIQSRAVMQAEPGAWRHAIRRVERAINPQIHISQAVGNQRISFVERAFGRKVIIMPPPGAEVAYVKGNHSVTFEGQKLADLRSIACLHLPLRAASELEKRVVDYKDRHAPFRISQHTGWRLDYWAERLATDKLMLEWAANSYDADGMLDVYGQKRPTIVDRRLVRHLARAERFRQAIGKAGGRWIGPLRFAFKVRPRRFTVPKNIKGMDSVPPAAAQ
ncbi:MAG TPA: glycosyltransferase family 2 protein [Dongiaceae bacterium]|nr:glycosyltransferase family 2 protein [Dongiaceae bacterium]